MAGPLSGAQPMFPVYFSRVGGADDREKQNQSIAENENCLNQNFAILYQMVSELAVQIGEYNGS